MTPLDELIRQRDTALLSLDAHRIRMFMIDWGIPVPADGRVFWGNVIRALREIGAEASVIREAERKLKEARK